MSTRQPTPQEQARLQAIKRQWEQRRRITQHLGKIRHKIGVYSGKGGVGKTTVAINIATLLAAQGARVGILDADIDCPNVVKAMKAETRPRYEEGILLPESKWGVKILSMGFFQQNDEEAIIWRGPMIHNALTQFLESTDWGDLDYLVTDLPPGTSDAPLTIMQTLPLDGFVAVTTPQELALTDAKRSINMVRKMNLPILGVVENLAGEIFGAGAGEALADQMDLEFLGRLNLRPDYRDTSKPTVLLSDQVRDEYQIIVSNIENRLSQTASTA
ncbi:MAG: Mrp/NBP35 family ATP-binding protein [SAR202 cluster bacterium]|nr:Mrp/NBP35 family ATP-binding protein [SAR202 cluster bacterium]|tara:strand:+ start:249 stop:1067 length:819 start_codon:yes stop_codon:yes gene_type:complete